LTVEATKAKGEEGGGTLGGGGLAGDTIGGRAVCWTATGREADAVDWGSSIDAGLGPLDLATAPAHEQM